MCVKLKLSCFMWVSFKCDCTPCCYFSSLPFFFLKCLISWCQCLSTFRRNEPNTSADIQLVAAADAGRKLCHLSYPQESAHSACTATVKRMQSSRRWPSKDNHLLLLLCAELMQKCTWLSVYTRAQPANTPAGRSQIIHHLQSLTLHLCTSHCLSYDVQKTIWKLLNLHLPQSRSTR